jgi:hypothetical protein
MNTTILFYGVAAILALMLIKFIIKIPYYLMMLAILCGMAYVGYYYVLPLFLR